MELMAYLVEIFPTVGFPIICCGALGWFVYKIYNQSIERENKLMEEITENRLTNAKFAEIIAQYEVKLDDIKNDVATIKTDVSVLMNK